MTRKTVNPSSAAAICDAVVRNGHEVSSCTRSIGRGGKSHEAPESCWDTTFKHCSKPPVMLRSAVMIADPGLKMVYKIVWSRGVCLKLPDVAASSCAGLAARAR